jgi:hypothetical protein
VAIVAVAIEYRFDFTLVRFKDGFARFCRKKGSEKGEANEGSESWGE